MDKNKIKEMVKSALSKPMSEKIDSKEYISNRKQVKEEKNPIDTITMDVPLFIRMMEFAREDVKSDLDLHDVAEKAISLSDEGKTLTMSDYETMFGGSELDEKKLTTAEKRKKEDIVMAMKKSFKGNEGAMYAIATDKAKKLAESDMNEAQPSSNESLAKKVEEVVKSLTILHKNTSNNSNIPETDKKGLLRAFDMLKGDLEVVVTNLKGGLSENMLDEAYVPDNIKKFAKQRGVSSLVNKAAGWAEKVGKRITGGTAIGKNYSTLILDMGYQTGDIRINTEDETIELYGEEVNSFPEFKEVYMNENSEDKIEENIQDDDVLGDMISDMLKYKTKEEVLQYLRQQVALHYDDVKDNKPKTPTTKQKSMAETIMSKLKGKHMVGDSVTYNNELHDVVRVEDDRIYIRPSDSSHILGKKNIFWVKKSDLND